jgi:hypothetical protein
MENIVHNAIFNTIEAQFVKIANQKDFTTPYKVLREQALLNTNTVNGSDEFIIDDKCIYIIVHFGLGTIMAGGGITIPMTFEVMSVSGNFEEAYNLLSNYAQTFSFVIPDVSMSGVDAYINQAYTMPEISSNFEELGTGFRSLMSINATFVYNSQVQFIKSIKVDNESLLFIGVTDGLTIERNIANLGNNNSRTKSLPRFGTYTCVISFIPLSNSSFVDKCLSILYNENGTLNQSVSLNIDGHVKSVGFVDIKRSQENGSIPSLTVSLTE